MGAAEENSTGSECSSLSLELGREKRNPRTRGNTWRNYVGEENPA